MGVYSGNRTLLGESSSMNDGSHIMDMVLECERNDLKMFNAVINCDFVEAFAEAGITTLTEENTGEVKTEAKKGIGKKIKEMFAKAIEQVKRFIATFIAKIKNLFANDAKLYKKYSANFTSNGVGYKISNWTPLKSASDFNIISKPVVDTYDSAVSSIEAASDSEAISTAISDAKKKMKEFNYGKTAQDAFFGSKVDGEHPLTSAEITLINDVVKNSTRTVNKIKKDGDLAIKGLKEAQTNLKFEKNQSDHDELSLAKINGKYKIANTFVSNYSKMLNAICNAYARYLAAARRAFVLAGKKGSKDDTASDATNESVFDYILGEASDFYVESVLLGM